MAFRFPDELSPSSLTDTERQFLSAVMDNAQLGIIAFDAGSKPFFVNASFTAMTGYTLADLTPLGAWLHRAYPDPTLRHRLLRLWREDRTRAFVEREHPLTCASGETHIINFRLINLPSGLKLATLVDVTANRRYAHMLATKELFLRKVFETLNDGLALTDADQTVIAVNQRYCEIMGKPRAEILGRTVLDYIDEGLSATTRATIRKQLQTRAAGKADVYEIDFRRSNGRNVHCLISAAPLFSETGHFNGSVAVVTDVTRVREMERALTESEKRYRAIVEDQTEYVCRFRRSGTLTYQNRAMQNLRLASQAPPSTFFDLISEPDRGAVRRGVSALCGACPIVTCQTSLTTADNTVRHLEWNVRIIFNDDGSPAEYQAVGRDVTRRVQYEQRLKENEKRLRILSRRFFQAQEQERQRLARELHDDVGQTLAAVKYAVENAILDVAPVADEASVKPLRSVVTLTQGLIDKIRNIQAALHPPSIEDLGLITSMNGFCAEYESIYSHVLVQKRIEIAEADIPASLKVTFYRIMQEAMSNAARHSGASVVWLTLAYEDAALVLRIRDNGCGFSLSTDAMRERITTGMGLENMRERTEMSGGDFGIFSQPGKGTVIQATWDAANG